jgi:hypothetical protein
MDAWMIDKRGPRLKAGVTAEIVSDDEDIPSRIVGFNVGEQSDVALGIARGGRAWSVLCHRVPVRPRRPRFSLAPDHSQVAL